MPFKEIHTNIKIKRPVRLRSDHTGIHPQIIVALVKQTQITLRLPGNILHGGIGKSRIIHKNKAIIDLHWAVNPPPLGTITVQFKQVRIIFRF